MFSLQVEMLKYIKQHPNTAAKDIIAKFNNEDVLHFLIDNRCVVPVGELCWPDLEIVIATAGEAALEVEHNQASKEKRELERLVSDRKRATRRYWTTTTIAVIALIGGYRKELCLLVQAIKQLLK